MDKFITVARVGEIPQGSAKAFRGNERMIAVFHSDDRYYAIDDMCPHMGASLADGHVQDQIVTCPWHAWRFSICDGTWCDNPTISIDSFKVRVAGDEIQVCIPDVESKRVDEATGDDEVRA